MAQTSVNFRMDAELKESVEEICRKMGDYKAGRLKLAEHSKREAVLNSDKNTSNNFSKHRI